MHALLLVNAVGERCGSWFREGEGCRISVKTSCLFGVPHLLISRDITVEPTRVVAAASIRDVVRAAYEISQCIEDIIARAVIDRLPGLAEKLLS